METEIGWSVTEDENGTYLDGSFEVVSIEKEATKEVMSNVSPLKRSIDKHIYFSAEQQLKDDEVDGAH